MNIQPTGSTAVVAKKKWCPREHYGSENYDRWLQSTKHLEQTANEPLHKEIGDTIWRRPILSFVVAACASYLAYAAVYGL